MAKEKTIDTPQPITDYGWYLHEKCRCGGILIHKYRHLGKKGLQLNWRVYYYDFKVFHGNSTKVGYTKIGQVESVLKDL